MADGSGWVVALSAILGIVAVIMAGSIKGWSWPWIPAVWTITSIIVLLIGATALEP